MPDLTKKRMLKEYKEMSFKERMEHFCRVQNASFNICSEEGKKNFISRNNRKRRVKYINGKWQPIGNI